MEESKRTKPSKPRERILSMVERLSEAKAVANGTHLSLEVRKKRFGWFLDDHHGDGRLALHCKASDIARARLIAAMPNHVHVAKYIGHHGWLGVWLDLPRVKWRLVSATLIDAYRVTAPKTLAGKVGSPWSE